MDFSTSQQYIVAALFSTPDITFEGARMAGGRVDFVFTPRDRAEKIVEDFYAGRLIVSAKQFADSIERFRDEAFSRRRGLAESERRPNNGYWK